MHSIIKLSLLVIGLSISNVHAFGDPTYNCHFDANHYVKHTSGTSSTYKYFHNGKVVSPQNGYFTGRLISVEEKITEKIFRGKIIGTRITPTGAKFEICTLN